MTIRKADNNNQKWKIVDAGNGYLKFAAKNNNNAVIDLNGGIIVNDGRIQVSANLAADNQLWQIVAVQ